MRVGDGWAKKLQPLEKLRLDSRSAAPPNNSDLGKTSERSLKVKCGGTIKYAIYKHTAGKRCGKVANKKENWSNEKTKVLPPVAG